MIKDYEALVEFRARTLWVAVHGTDERWGDYQIWRDVYRKYALDTILAEWQAGVACVPRSRPYLAIAATPYKPEDTP